MKTLIKVLDKTQNSLVEWARRHYHNIDRYIVIATTFLYGAQLFLHSDILSGYRVYQIISQGSTLIHSMIGILFMAIALIKAVGLYTNNVRLRRLGITMLTTVWTFYLISFAVSPPPNTVWVTSFAMLALCLKIAISE